MKHGPYFPKIPENIFPHKQKSLNDEEKGKRERSLKEMHMGKGWMETGMGGSIRGQKRVNIFKHRQGPKWSSGDGENASRKGGDGGRRKKRRDNMMEGIFNPPKRISL